MPHGKLTVIVESATSIKDPTLDGRGDSYCTLQCGNQILSTHVAEGEGSYPVFHTEFEFEIDRSTNDLSISVYSIVADREDELVGYTTLNFKQVFFNSRSVPQTAYPLTRLSGKSGGCINISLEFKSRPSPYAQSPHAIVRQQTAPSHYDEGYGSSGSDSSRSGSRRGIYTRSQSQPEPYHDDEEYYEEPTYEAAPQPQYDRIALAHQPGPRRPAAPRGGPRQPIPGGPRIGVANPYRPQQPQQQMYARPQQPMYVRPQQAMYAQPQQAMYAQPQQAMYAQPQQAMYAQRQQAMYAQPQPQVPSAGVQIGQALAAGAARATVQGLFGLISGGT